MFFHFDLKKALIVLLFLTLPVVLFNLEPSLNLISKPFVQIGHGLQTGLDAITRGIGSTTNTYFNLVSIKQLNKELLKEVSKLRMDQVFYQELLLENERLHKLLDLQKKSSMKLESATLTSEDLLSDTHSLTLTKGSNHKVKEHMGVLGLNGVIGETLKVSMGRTQVLTILNRFFVIESLIQRSRQSLILEGTGSQILIAKHLAKNIDIQVGDLIVTSGKSGIFSKGLPIGVVAKVESSNSEITKFAEIKPIADIYNTEEFFIILDPKSSEQNLEKTSAQEDTLSQ